MLRDAQMLVIPGGFSFADALGAGRLFALELTTHLSEHLTEFVAAGKPVIGICNGFQTLIRTGLLSTPTQRIALGHNTDDQGAATDFVCKWVRLQPTSSRCVWTTGLTEEIHCPIAHGEGRVVAEAATAQSLRENDQVALTYVGHNPNGSLDNIAGITDATGLVLGLMPHPEDHVLARQHPQVYRGHTGGLGLAIFESGVRHALLNYN
jgi:phosphoribosylformylglycinamidine synthase subunit PurQ / glutaminase